MGIVRPWIVRSFWMGTFACLAAALAIAWRVPIGSDMGAIEKLFYLHVPIAINTYVASLVVFIASVAYLAGRKTGWDDLASAAARVTVLNGSVLMVTGVVWAKVWWGHWWVWSPRLTFSLVLWGMYIAYLVVRMRVRSETQRAVVSAAYGVVAFLNVPLAYLTAKMIPDVHPAHLELSPMMEQAVLVWFIAITMLTGGLIGSRYSLARESRRGHEPRLPIIPTIAGGLS